MKTLKSKLFKTLFAAPILVTAPVSSLTVTKEIEPKLYSETDDNDEYGKCHYYNFIYKFCSITWSWVILLN